MSGLPPKADLGASSRLVLGSWVAKAVANFARSDLIALNWRHSSWNLPTGAAKARIAIGAPTRRGSLTTGQDLPLAPAARGAMTNYQRCTCRLVRRHPPITGNERRPRW